jgi:hypothetical protein
MSDTSPLDFFKKNTEYADENLQMSRIQQCIDCDKYLKMTSQCKECLCIMPLKVKLLNSKCPLGKW